MSTEYRGIDYGRGITNKDHESNIRYGVISIYEVTQAWCDSSEANYGMNDSEDIPCNETEDDFADPISFFIDDGEYLAEQTFDDTDIFITKSPYYTYSQFCSPCAPGAGYLMNELTTKDPDNKTYCFGHDWFEGGKAPYTVYRVSDDSVV